MKKSDCNVYRSSSMNIDDIKALIGVLRRYGDISYNLCIVGDFNFPQINWINLSGDNLSNYFLELTHELSLKQFVMDPTRGENILDLVFGNKTDLVSDIHVCETFSLSDHSYTTFNILINAPEFLTE